MVPATAPHCCWRAWGISGWRRGGGLAVSPQPITAPLLHRSPVGPGAKSLPLVAAVAVLLGLGKGGDLFKGLEVDP